MESNRRKRKKVYQRLGVGFLVLIFVLGFLFAIIRPFPHYPGAILKDCGKWSMSSEAQRYEPHKDVSNRLDWEDFPACGLKNTDPQYCVLNNGALLDKSHIVTYLAHDFWVNLSGMCTLRDEVRHQI